MGKKSKSKAGGDFWDEEPEVAETSPQEPEVESPSHAAPTEGNLDDEFGNDGLLGALKRSKKKKADKEAEEAQRAAEKAAESTPVVKSKKEKEREKKEREKAKKRAAAQRKVPAPPTKKEAKEEAESREESAEPAPAPEKTEKAKPKKKLNPALLALQKQQEARRAAEEARTKAEAEEARLEAEEREKEEAERKEKEEQQRLKQERDRKKKEELRAQGKLLTRKQKEQQALQARRREQLLNSGNVRVAAFSKKDSKEERDKKKEKEEKEKLEKEKLEKEREQELREAAKEAQKAELPNREKLPNQEMAEEEEEDALLEDWEAGISEEDEPEPQPEPEVKEAEPEPKKEEATKAEPQVKEPAESQSILQTAKLDAEKRKLVDEKREARQTKALQTASASNLRSPICAILGHVDTGKTKLLDNMRRTNVQEGEAGGITQQIGATYFPIDSIRKKTAVMTPRVNVQYNVPGLLIIDTPGHESFSNLRSRGSSLCNIAILVVDIMHGLEAQTLESIRLLKDRKTPFVVALNKIDRLYGWKATPDNSFLNAIEAQAPSVRREFEDRLKKTKLLFAEQGFNAELYTENKNLSKNVSLVPTSAVTGEGVPDLIYLLLELTQSRMSKQLMYLSQLEATILEVKVIEGLGTTIDVILSNGVLKEGDRVVLCGMNGPIATNVRALLTPQPLRELRIKSAYVHHKEVKAALGVKVAANGLDFAVAGSRLLLVGPDDDENDLMDDVMDDMTSLLDSVDKNGQGVCVQASTLGSLEALLDFLKAMKIPVMSISIGPVFKRDVMRATTMLDKNKEYAVMLCFDVKVDKEAEQYANEQGIKLFTADIIYHLFDEFTAYQKQLLEQRRKDNVAEAVFPCVLSTIQIINKRNPMIIGVDVEEGSLRTGTPIAVVKTDPVTNQKVVYNLGRVQSMEVDHKSKDVVRRGEANAGVAIRLNAGNSSNQPTWGRHIDEKDPLYSLISRKSIDVLKDPAFRDQVPRDDWLLIKKMKTLFDIK